tara:strand:- start:638 stop:1252 length:615 start_codon:yes stop_codon:yes gene_type:complete
MPPPPKKKRENGASASLAWHPNFRSYEKLPDLKVVRTAFFINGAAVFVAIVMALLFAFREFEIKTLRGDIAIWDATIERDRVASGEAVAKFRKFQAAERLVKEASTLVSSQIVVSDFLLHLGAELPDNIALTEVDFRPVGVVLTGVVRGAPELASGYASQYVDQLRKDEKYGPMFADITMTGLERDPTSGRITIAIALNYPVKK